MDILFVHQNFPGQYGHLARVLAGTQGVRVAVVTHKDNTQKDTYPTVRYAWETKTAGQPDSIAANYTLRASRGRIAAKAMLALRERGFNPAIMMGHLGWGETLFARDVFPDAKHVIYAEFFYSAKGADVGFDPEFATPDNPDQRFALRAKNAAILAAMADADIGVAPTRWQTSRFPDFLQPKLRTIHDGIDTTALKPDPAAVFRVPGTELQFRPGDEVITFLNRNLEPYRGYHIFMRALPEILAARPKAHAIIVGGDQVSYGAAAPAGKTWKDIFLDEVRGRLPMERVHFTGRVPFPQFVALMQVSAAHVYLTYPFVLSWSMLQAMSAGVPLVASGTPPVTEVVEDGKQGLLFDFFDKAALAQRVIDVLARPDHYRPMREAARRHVVENYDLAKVCLPQWLSLLKGLVQT